jgi:glycosyltransferase involved in cell wall biosynthesis
MREISVGYFPYDPGVNPYQRLFAEAVEFAGCEVRRIAPKKLFPLRHAVGWNCDLLQLDWPHDWYQGRNAWTRAAKQFMYLDGLRLLRSIPVVWTAHNLRAHDAPDAAFEHRMIQALIDVCDGIIVLSEASGAQLRSEYRVPATAAVKVVHHGHYIGCYPNKADRTASRERIGIPESARAVLTLGRLQPYKGLEELVEAFGRVATPQDVLLLVGKVVSPSYADRLNSLAKEASRRGRQVRIVDRVVPDDQLQFYFNACDVVALPFKQVLNSGSLLLAMSFGCPVVAPRMGSIPEVACPEGWFGYDAEDMDGLSVALSNALRASGGDLLKQTIRDFTARRYSWTIVGERVRLFYSEVLDARARRHDSRQ